MGLMEPSVFEARLLRVSLWVFFSLALLDTVSFVQVAHDDIYIFYSYARNIAAGNGYVFNLGERVLGTTSPLYTLILGVADFLLGWVPGDPMPYIGLAVSGASVLAIGLFLRRIFIQAGLLTGALLVPIIFLAMPLLWAGVGMDVLPGLALSMACLDQYRRSRMSAVALLGALAVLARPDMIIVPVLLFLDFVRAERRLPPKRTFGIFFLVVGSWLLFSFFYFGTMMPASISAKLHQTSTGAWGKGWIFLDRFMKSWPFHVSFKDAIVTLFYISLPLLVLGRRSWSRSRSIVLILIWLLLYLAAYGWVLNPPGYMWYYTPFAIGFALVLGLAADIVHNWVQSRHQKAATLVLTSFAVLAFIGAVRLPVAGLGEPRAYKYLFYREAASWLNDEADPGDSVGCMEIGVLGYYYRQGPIIDGLGLVTPGVKERVAAGDFSWWIRHYKPDFLVFREPPMPVMEDAATESWFLNQYDLEIVLGEDRRQIGIYRRLDSESKTGAD